jgi:hypothetical protein
MVNTQMDTFDSNWLHSVHRRWDKTTNYCDMQAVPTEYVALLTPYWTINRLLSTQFKV